MAKQTENSLHPNCHFGVASSITAPVSLGEKAHITTSWPGFREAMMTWLLGWWYLMSETWGTANSW